MVEFIRQTILPLYGIAASDVTSATIAPLGNGHINQTYLVKWPAGQMVLQQINTTVFTKPDVLIDNAAKVSHHLIQKSTLGEYQLDVISPVVLKDGSLSVNLGDKGYWRAISYLANSHTIEVVTNQDEAKMAASAFGHFAHALSDLDANSLQDVIPNFLNLPLRIQQLKQAVADDKSQRLADCQQWVDLVLSQQALFAELAQVEQQLPLRICHNDTKINNMLFDKRDMSSMAVIDIDTCMKGYLMYDFGDMVRAFCSPEEEDSTALDKVIARPEIIKAATQAYTEQLSAILTPLEKRSLWLGIKVMALMLGSRFLTDHLNGDVYFGIHREGHNLDRAANQLTIYNSLVAQEAQLVTLFE
ncbi:aminoglycoside phosphotransferase [Shewanella sp. 10N.286.52.C2]|uniref:phosphotransferase enzyme family protein n=1 Tax=unclassified Shewanella TaxID=196818 RepID=UPI000C83DFD1|nr:MULTISPECIES: aminoglycoside phosphotransferase family protein [unclassified Shewanella]MDO6618492.1 aminoglycoside phosphotransferase family protein [Shewanella sp. 6_MG-2023]MDO6680289.1 aminoglycoside phosphotransferase family protein [Shewanella sp. 4_MG-2023]PMG28930.1 aminoglycoside phosphotransferase [Shewanella sp. 10N.286.52.C2]PMH98620.1 aminoglycoside phosphotransferase [Shewanella sp. 10N.286.48.A6]